jgi:hypothetical protein
MIKKIYSLSFSIVCAGFLWNAPTVHAMPGCEIFCQPKICTASPDLAAICFKDCPQAQACHMAAFEEFRRLHEIHNRPHRGQKPRKDRDGIKRERGAKLTESQPNASSLTSELPTVPLSSESPLPINNATETSTLNDPVISTETSLIPPVEEPGDLLTQPNTQSSDQLKPTTQPIEEVPGDTSLNNEPVLTEIPVAKDEPATESSLIPPPPPPPSDLPAVGKPLVNVGEDLLTQLNNKRGELKKPAEITDPKSTPQGENEATAGKNNMLEALRKAMKDRRAHIDPDDTDSPKDNASPSSDDWGDD